MILLAPTEHELQKVAAALQTFATTNSNTSPPPSIKVSSLPEQHGCDILSLTKSGILGFQRKTIPDLFASLQDGRLYYEVDQITASATLTHSYLIIESVLPRTMDNNLTEAAISVNTLRSLIAKLGAKGIVYLPTSSPTDTLDCVISLSRYVSSSRFAETTRAKLLTNEWGKVSSESYSLFLLQSFPGIGPKSARAILDHFRCVPLHWSITAADLAQVPGIGRKTAERLIAALDAQPSVQPSVQPSAAVAPQIA